MGEIKVNKFRKDSNHAAKKVRKKGNISCNMYGEEAKKYLYEISELDFKKEISANKNGVMNFIIDGMSEKVLIREIQKDPVSRKIIHIDAQKVKPENVIECSVAVDFQGEESLERQGLILQRNHDNIKVRCKVLEKPEKVLINLANYKMGDVIKACDVEFGPEISIISNLDTIIGSIGKIKLNNEENIEEILE